MPVDSKNNNNRNSFVEHSDISSRLTASSIITSEFSLACNTRTIDTWHFETTPKVELYIYIYTYFLSFLNKNRISENSSSFGIGENATKAEHRIVYKEKHRWHASLIYSEGATDKTASSRSHGEFYNSNDLHAPRSGTNDRLAFSSMLTNSLACCLNPYLFRLVLFTALAFFLIYLLTVRC